MWGKIKALAFLVAALATAFVIHDWFAARRDAAQLKATLATEKKVIDAASERETARNRDLQTALAQIETLKKQTKTPRQTATELQKYLQLPVPIEAIPPDASAQLETSGGPEEVTQGTISLPAKSQVKSMLLGLRTDQNAANLPPADVEPLYNYVQDCRECQLKLAAADANLSDAKSQLDAVTKERDAAFAGKRHSLLHRIRTNVLWFAVGVGAGLTLSDGGALYHAIKH